MSLWAYSFALLLLLFASAAVVAALQEKVLTPKQVSGLESLLAPPLAAAWQCLTGRRQHCPIAFGAQLSSALRRAAAADWAGQGSCSAGRQGQLLQKALQEQKAAADRQYLLLVTGKPQNDVGIRCCCSSCHWLDVWCSCF
jgi:hypothetical protein